MTELQAHIVRNNINEIAQNIANKVEDMLSGDMVDVYFFLTNENEVDYSFSKDSDTIMTVTARSQEFYRDDCEGYVEPTTFELELEQNANFRLE